VSAVADRVLGCVVCLYNCRVVRTLYTVGSLPCLVTALRQSDVLVAIRGRKIGVKRRSTLGTPTKVPQKTVIAVVATLSTSSRRDDDPLRRYSQLLDKPFQGTFREPILPENQQQPDITRAVEEAGIEIGPFRWDVGKV
jgi:hypothetical protein